MQLYCTRPGCSRPVNAFSDLDDLNTLKTVQQKFCMNCGMELILIGRYLPTRFLGQGGFGTTFLGRDRYTPGLRHCVVKQFQPIGTLNPEQLKKAQDFFEREAEVLENLGNKHPQIPDLYAFFELSVNNPHLGKVDKFFYLVQEFIDGQTLEEELNQKRQFSEAEVLEVLQEVLKILQFVHSKGSIHRDIKPSNIIRQRDGLLFLLDFGAVKNVAAAGTSQTPSIIYSAGYAPPEQMYGGQVNPSSDLYALAVTGLVLLMGKPPNELFDSNTQTWTWHSQLQISSTLAEVFDRLLLPAPQQRYQSAQEVLAALAPQPIVSPPVASPVVPSVASPVAPPTAPPSVPPASRSSVSPALPDFSTSEILGNAAFTGFQGGLIAIALVSLFGTTWLSAGFWIVLLGILIVAQRMRVIEKVDLGILAGISFGVVGFIPLLHKAVIAWSAGNPWGAILIFAGVAALGAICITSLFQLIYRLLSRLL